MIRTKQISAGEQVAQRQPQAAEDQPDDVQDQAHFFLQRCRPAYRVNRGAGRRGVRVGSSHSRPAQAGRVPYVSAIERDKRVRPVPTGKVKWYDAEKGFGFLSQEEGEDVYVRSSALPAGVEELKAGQKVEFGMAAGRRGPQALSLKLIDPPPSLTSARAARPTAAEHKHTPDELHGMVEDMITLLEGAVQPELRKGKYPDRKIARRVSEVVKAVAQRARRLTPTHRSVSRGMLTRGCLCRRRWRVQPRHQLHHHPHHRRRPRRLSGRAGPLPADRRPGLPVGQPGDHRAPAARPGRRSLHWLLRADARRAQLDVRPRSRWRRPGAEDPAAAGRLLRPLPGLPEGHHGAGDRRRADRAGRHQRLRADDAGPVDRVDGVPPRRARRSSIPSRCAPRSTRWPSGSTPRSTTACTAAASPARRRPTTAAYDRLFTALDWLSERLSGQRYLVGDTITEADVRLFTTLARFDPVYHGHFKCNRSKLDRDAGAVGLRARPVPDARLRRHHRLRPDQAALLHRAHRHQPDQDRAEGPGPVELADAARPGSVGRQAIRRRHAAGADPPRASRCPPGHSAPARATPCAPTTRRAAAGTRCPPRRAPAWAVAPRCRSAAAVRVDGGDGDRQRACRAETSSTTVSSGPS